MFSSKCKNNALRIKVVEWQRNALRTMVGEENSVADDLIDNYHEDGDDGEVKSRDQLEEKHLEYRSVEKLTTVKTKSYDKHQYPSAASNDVFDFEDNCKSFRKKSKQNVTVCDPKSIAKPTALIFYPPSAALQKSSKSKRQNGSEFTVSPQHGATDSEDDCTLSPQHRHSHDDSDVTEVMETQHHRTTVIDTQQSQAQASVAVIGTSLSANYPDPAHVEDNGSFHRDLCVVANGESAIDKISVTECPITLSVRGFTEATSDVSNTEMRNSLNFLTTLQNSSPRDTAELLQLDSPSEVISSESAIVLTPPQDSSLEITTGPLHSTNEVLRGSLQVLVLPLLSLNLDTSLRPPLRKATASFKSRIQFEYNSSGDESRKTALKPTVSLEPKVTTGTHESRVSNSSAECGQFITNGKELMLHEKTDIFETDELFERHLHSDSPREVARESQAVVKPVLGLNLVTSPRPLSRKATRRKKFRSKRYVFDSSDDESSKTVGRSTRALESAAQSELTAKSSKVTSETECGKPTTGGVEIWNEPPLIFDITDFVVINGKKYVAIESPSRDSKTDAGRCVSGSRDSAISCKTATRTNQWNASNSTENCQNSVEPADGATQQAPRITEEIGERNSNVELSSNLTFSGTRITEQYEPSRGASRGRHHEDVHGIVLQRQLKEIGTSVVSEREAIGSEICVLNADSITSPSCSQVSLATPTRETWNCSRKRGTANRSLHGQFIESIPGSQRQSGETGGEPIVEQRLASQTSMHRITKSVRVAISRISDTIETLQSPEKRIKIEAIGESCDQLVLSKECPKINTVRSNDVEATDQRLFRRSASSRNGSSTSSRRHTSVSTSPKSTEPRADREHITPEKTPSSPVRTMNEMQGISPLRTPQCAKRTDPDYRYNLKDAATPNSLTETPIRMLRDLDISLTPDKTPQYAVWSSVPSEVGSSHDVSAVIKRTVQDRCVVVGVDSQKLDSISRETFQDSSAVHVCVPTEQYITDQVTGKINAVSGHPGDAEHVHEAITVDVEQTEKITTRGDDTACTLDEIIHTIDIESGDEEHSWISIDGNSTSDGPDETCKTKSCVADCESSQDEQRMNSPLFSLTDSESSPRSTLLDNLEQKEASFEAAHKPEAESYNTAMSESPTCGDKYYKPVKDGRVAAVVNNKNVYVATPLESYETQRRTSIGSPSTSDLVIRLEKCAVAMNYSYKFNQADGHTKTAQQNAPAAIIAERTHTNPREQTTDHGSSDTIQLAVLQSDNSAAVSSDTVLHEGPRKQNVDESNVSPMRVGPESQRSSATRWAPKTLTMNPHGRNRIDSIGWYWEDVSSDSSTNDEIYNYEDFRRKSRFNPFDVKTKKGICGLCKLPRHKKIEQCMLVKIRKCDETGEANENENKSLLEWRKAKNITNGEDNNIDEGTDDGSERMPCAYCMKSVVKANIHEHYKKCNKHALYYDQLTGDSAKAAVREYDVRRRADQSFLKELWNRMFNDKIKRIVFEDSLIRRYACLKMEALGAKEFQKLTEVSQISAAIRRIGKIVQLARRDFKGIGLSELITPNKFDYVLTLVKTVLIKQKKCIASSKFATILRHLARTKNGLALRDNDDSAAADARQFLLLIDCEWNRRVTTATNKMFRTDRIARVKILPLTEDLVKLRNHTLSEMKRLMEELKVVQTLSNWLALTYLTIVRLVTFNKRRSAEVATLKVKQYLQRPKWHDDERGELAHVLSPDDHMLAKSMDMVVNVGKSCKNVPAYVLLPPETRKAIDILIKCRKSVGISPTNPYIFARPRANTPLYFCNAIKVVTRGCEGLQHPERICSNSLRKYVATVAQIIGINDADTEHLARHLGHDVSMHKDVYRLSHPAIQLSKVAQTLLAVDNGRLHDFKSPKDISVTDLPSTGYNFDKCDAKIKSHEKKKVTSVTSESLKTDKSDAAMEVSFIRTDKSNVAIIVPEIDVGSASPKSSRHLETASSDGKSTSTHTMNAANIPAEDNSLTLELLGPDSSFGELEIPDITQPKTAHEFWSRFGRTPSSRSSTIELSDVEPSNSDSSDVESLVVEIDGQPNASKSLGEHDIETVSRAGHDKWWFDSIDLAPLGDNSHFSSCDGDLDISDAGDLDSLMLEETDQPSVGYSLEEDQVDKTLHRQEQDSSTAMETTVGTTMMDVSATKPGITANPTINGEEKLDISECNTIVEAIVETGLPNAETISLEHMAYKTAEVDGNATCISPCGDLVKASGGHDNVGTDAEEMLESDSDWITLEDDDVDIPLARSEEP